MKFTDTFVRDHKDELIQQLTDWLVSPDGHSEMLRKNGSLESGFPTKNIVAGFEYQDGQPEGKHIPEYGQKLTAGQVDWLLSQAGGYERIRVTTNDSFFYAWFSKSDESTTASSS